MGPKPLHGEFMWNELMTRDDEKALAFFEKLLGWTHQDWPLGPGKAPYRIAKAGGKPVAGIMKMTEPEFPAPVPTHWCGYIAVRDVDASWKQIAKLGGTQIHPPTDIPNVGRFCVFKDPTGAVLALMTPAGGVI
ncbi:MAG: VOC family protein [Planctomycetes bacterium]|nr:VOC family protein [Planctomycetota bacterium]